MEGEARNITPTIAFFLGAGLAEQLGKRFKVPTTSLRVSVSSLAHLPPKLTWLLQ